MRVRRAVLTVAWTGVALVGSQLARAQEATSANLPDQFQTGEMIQIQKSRKKKANSQNPATAPNQNTAPLADQPLAAEELPPLIVPSAEKKREATPVPATMASRGTPPPRPVEQPVTPEESPPATAPARQPRPKKRPPPDVESEVAGVSEPVSMSLSVAQSMAVSAPLPEYTYEAKRRNLTGNGICVVSVEVATGRVTDAMMSKSTGSTMLDKLTVQTFKSWRFKPGTVSQVLVPISYE
jgi:periplasmic protein TonB